MTVIRSVSRASRILVHLGEQQESRSAKEIATSLGLALPTAYHLLGIFEVWYILSRLSNGLPSVLTSFLLESVSRMITILFKVIPFVIGVDEAGAQFVGTAVGLAAGVGITMAIIRKGRIIFWTLIGLLIIAKRGLSIRGLWNSQNADES